MPTEEGRGKEEGGKVYSTVCSYVSPRSTEPVVVLDKQSDIKQIKVCFILHAVALLLVLLLLRVGLSAASPGSVDQPGSYQRTCIKKQRAIVQRIEHVAEHP